MRGTVLGLIAGAGMMLAVCSLGANGPAAQAQRPIVGSGASEGLIALPSTSADGRQVLSIVDPRTQTLAVYTIDASRGEIALKGVRKIYWDLQIEEYNGTVPLPSEVRSLVEQR